CRCRRATGFLFNRSYFFFSSRRRHTSSKRDWSSDVCSSDLRVSTRNQKEYLQNQLEFFRKYTLNLGIPIGNVYTDYGSGLNYNRSEERRVGKECSSLHATKSERKESAFEGVVVHGR